MTESPHGDPVDSPYVARAELLVGAELVAMLESEALPAAGVDPEQFWHGLSGLIHDLAPRNVE
ncbi:MAG TPA: hypothetical protein VHN36_20315, partial [Ilumatobacteraceae bacterium]|nr:hypothetical protein [Ilumatobacteraceae bacterium]